MRRTFSLAVLITALVASACGGDPELVEDTIPTVTPTPAESSTTTSTTAPSSPECGSEFPVFYPGLEPVEGEARVEPGSDGQMVRLWRDGDLDVTIEARWPVPQPVEGGAESIPVDEGEIVLESVVDRRILDNGSVVTIDIGGPAGCDLMEVTVTGSRLEPLVDFELSFIQDIRPISELDAFLNPEQPEMPPVPAAPAYQVVAEFLEAAGDGEWDFASSLLFNEGWSQAVEDKIGLTLDNWDQAPALLQTYCASALCSAPYRLTGIERDGAWIAAVLVEFDTASGAVEWRAPVGQFEGIYSLSDLPPKGTATDRAFLSERLFGTQETFAAIWYDAVQFNNPTGSQWSRWWVARFGNNHVLNRWGISYYAGGVAVEDLVGEFETEFVELNEVPYLGTGVFGGREVVYLGTGNALLELDVAGLGIEPKLEASDPEAFVGSATAAGDTLAMLVGVGDSLWVDFYDGDLQLISTTRGQGVYAFVDLDSTGTAAAVAVEPELHVINQVALVDVATGSQLQSWGFPPEVGNITAVAYNGRYIVARVATGDEPPQLFVVDTSTGDANLIQSPARIQF